MILAYMTNNPFTRSKNYLDHDLDCNLHCNLDRHPEDVPIYKGHSLFNTTKGITLMFIVQSLLHRNPPNIWIKIIQIAIQIMCLSRTKFLNPERDFDLDNLAPCRRDTRLRNITRAFIKIYGHHRRH